MTSATTDEGRTAGRRARAASSASASASTADDADPGAAIDDRIDRPDDELSVLDVLVQRVLGNAEVDEWGLDADLGRLAHAVGSLRWDLDVTGAEHLPAGPALLVHNRAVGLSEPAVIATAVAAAVGRTVRSTGLPADGVLGAALARIGGVPTTAADVRSLLRAGQLVSVGLANEPLAVALAGDAPLELVAPAVEGRYPIVPVAVLGRELGRRWRVRIGRPLRSRRKVSSLLVADQAVAARDAVQDLLRHEF